MTFLCGTAGATISWNERMRIKSNGKVGIGTANAQDAELAIKSGSNFDLELYSESGGSAWQSYNRTTSSWGYIRLIAGGGEQMRIASNGNVGIGTTNPGAKLDVGGDLRVGNVGSTSSTTNHETVLRVKGKNNYSDGTTWYGDYGQIILHADTNMTGSARRYMITNALNNNKFAIVRSVNGNTDPLVNSTSGGDAVNSGTADFVIDNSGNVGIGTTSPSGKLNIETTGNHLHLRANTATAGKYWNFDVTSANQLYIINNGGTGINIRDNGHVGIGTTSQAGSAQLSIGLNDSDGGRIALTNLRTALFNADSLGRIEFVSNDSTSTGVKAMIIARAEDTSANTNLQFHTGGTLTERMRISSSGRITMPGLDGKTQVHPDVSYRTSDGELFYQTSSERYKTDIVNLESSLNKIDSLRPVRFTDINTNEPGFGLIAEETNEVIPEVVFSKDDQIEGISYSNLTPFLIKAIQELKVEVETLKNQINGTN